MVCLSCMPCPLDSSAAATACADGVQCHQPCNVTAGLWCLTLAVSTLVACHIRSVTVLFPPSVVAASIVISPAASALHPSALHVKQGSHNLAVLVVYELAVVSMLPLCHLWTNNTACCLPVLPVSRCSCPCNLCCKCTDSCSALLSTVGITAPKVLHACHMTVSNMQGECSTSMARANSTR